MNRHLLSFITILVLGTAGIVGWKYARPVFQERLQKGSSDASTTRAVLHIGTDNWIGYFPLCSPVMERNLYQADYRTRFKKLAAGELQFAVATIDSYLLNGGRFDYPGTIILVVDESKGGDALVARKSVVATIDDLKNRPKTKIAFTRASPSEHLLKALSDHFGLPFFADQDSGKWAVATEGSEQALKKLQNGAVDVAVLWEPDVSRALASPKFVKLMGTEDTDKLIVDVLLVGRRFSIDHPEAVKALLHAYFKTQKEYRQNPDALRGDIKKVTGLSNTQINAMLHGVEWATLGENTALWFGSAQNGQKGDEGLLDAISFALQVLRSSGDLKNNPLPDSDPYRITNRSFIREIAADRAGDDRSINGRDHSFSRLTSSQWARLKKIGTLKVEPIPFRRSTALLDNTGQTILDTAADKLRRYPNFRVLVEGHTGLRGDTQANLDLSVARAKAVAIYLINTFNLDPNRFRAVGYGSSRPLPRQPEESSRAYKYRLSRVDITLVTE